MGRMYSDGRGEVPRRRTSQDGDRGPLPALAWWHPPPATGEPGSSRNKPGGPTTSATDNLPSRI
jgi:hypothetical protein